MSVSACHVRAETQLTRFCFLASSLRVHLHVHSPPKKPMTDDVTGEPLVQRSDDNVEALRKRLKVFHSQTGPVVDYYKTKGIWYPIDAAQSPKLVWENLRSILVKTASS